MPLDITTLQRSQKYRQARQIEDREVAEQLAECAVETRTHRAFVSDLPDLTGDADPVPVNLRAVLLQREIDKLRACNDGLREVLAELMELAAHDLDLLARARTAYLRAGLA